MENENNKGLTPEEEKELFSNLEFEYSRSKDDVWNKLEQITSGKTEESSREEADKVISIEPVEEAKGTKVISINWKAWSVAASVVLILSAGLFARFYSTTVEVAPGEFTSHTLPDGSEVHLNAESTMSYNRYWWKVDREVRFEGEAYFVVAKGKKFSVVAEMGTTEVLGTEFNVYARDDDFNVYCETGRVKVTTNVEVQESPTEVILTPGELAKLEPASVVGSIQLTKQTEAVPQTEILSWRTGQFIYNNTPLSKVFEDVQRHYGATIRLDDPETLKLEYSGALKRNIELDQALEAICLTKNLSFDKTGDRTYLIKRK